MRNRAAILGELICLDRPVDQIVPELAAFGWDSDVELVRLDKQHIRKVLERFIKGEAGFSARDVQAWAEAIEGRDDIGFEGGAEGLLKRIIFDLANPEITLKLTPPVAKEFLNLLASNA
jgi:hypothetical protein